MGEFGTGVFQAALISKGLKIICNVLREIYTPQGYRGRGCLKNGYWPVTCLTD
jgi:hypothetical protein